MTYRWQAMNLLMEILHRIIRNLRYQYQDVYRHHNPRKKIVTMQPPDCAPRCSPGIQTVMYEKRRKNPTLKEERKIPRVYMTKN